MLYVATDRGVAALEAADAAELDDEWLTALGPPRLGGIVVHGERHIVGQFHRDALVAWWFA